jgi:FAR1 DNA-binding domain
MLQLSEEFHQVDMSNINPPKVGMVFDSPEDAFQFYKQYSCKIGFGITRRTSHNFYGIKYDVTFSCNKNRPTSRKKKEEGFDCRSKGSIGTGCRAKIVLRDRLLRGCWSIEEVILEHNHELTPDSVRLMRCHRDIPLFVKKQLEINELAGL